MQELVAEKPTEDSVATLHRTLAIVSSVGSVCELSTVTKFFNGNPVLGSLGAGIDTFSGRSGRKRWGEIETVIGRNWDKVVDAIDEVVTTPDVDGAASEKAAAELEEPKPEPEEVEELAETDAGDVDEVRRRRRRGSRRRARRAARAAWCSAPTRTSGTRSASTRSDHDPRRHLLHAALLPRRRAGFLGRNGRVSVFRSERSLARYLADEHDHDLSDLATYDDIKTAATDGSLRIDVTDDNVYVMSGLADDLADGPDAVDRDQLELAVELLRDVSDYSEDDVVDETLDADMPLGRLVAHVLDPGHGPQAQPAVRRRRRAVGVAGDLPRVAAAPRVALPAARR